MKECRNHLSGITTEIFWFYDEIPHPCSWSLSEARLYQVGFVLSHVRVAFCFLSFLLLFIFIYYAVELYSYENRIRLLIPRICHLDKESINDDPLG